MIAIWEIGKCMWKKDYPNFYNSVNAFSWSPVIRILVEALLGLNFYKKKHFIYILTLFKKIRGI